MQNKGMKSILVAMLAAAFLTMGGLAAQDSKGECMKACQKKRNDRVAQCKADFNKKECPKGDQECKKTIQAERQACIKAANKPNCNTKCESKKAE